MKRYFTAVLPFLMMMVANAQSIPVNRLNQLFWGDLIVDQPFYVGDMNMERNKLGKRQLLQDNLLGIGNAQQSRFTNAYSFANPGLMTYANLGMKIIEINKTGNGLSGVDWMYSFKRINSIRMSYINQNDFSNHRSKGNHLNVYGDFQKSFGYALQPLNLYFSYLANYKDQSVGFGLKESELRERRSGELKTPRDMYVSKGLVISNHLGMVKIFRKWSRSKDLVINHRNTVALNHTYLNGTRQYIDRQITDVSSARLNVYDGFSKIKVGAEYLYRYTLETDSSTVLTNQKLNDWAVFGSIEQSFSNASTVTLDLRTDYSRLNGFFFLPNLEYSYRKTKFNLQLKAFKFINDDISVTEYFRPYLQGNRGLNLNRQNQVEKGNAIIANMNFYIKQSTLSSSFAVRDHKVKKVLSLNDQFNALSMNNVKDLEYMAFVQFNSRLLNKTNSGINTLNVYKFQTFANAQNSLNQARHSIYNELNFNWRQFYSGRRYGSTSIKLSIAQTSRLGIDNHFPNQVKNGNELLICDAKLSFAGIHVQELLKTIFSRNEHISSNNSKLLYNLRFEFSVYDVFSRQVRGNYNLGVQGFSGTTVPLMNYRYGTSVVMML